MDRCVKSAFNFLSNKSLSACKCLWRANLHKKYGVPVVADIHKVSVNPTAAAVAVLLELTAPKAKHLLEASLQDWITDHRVHKACQPCEQVLGSTSVPKTLEIPSRSHRKVKAGLTCEISS